jgi:hypothetical protein
MPLFDRFGLDGWTVLRAVMFAGAPSDAASARIASENFKRGIEPDERGAARLARTRWLEENRAERSFPCGTVPDPAPAATPPKEVEREPAGAKLPSEAGWAAPDPAVTPQARPDPRPLMELRPMQVIAAVLPKDLVFIREHGTDEGVEEVGRLPRSAIGDVDVVDPNGAPVPEPLREEIDEPEQLVFASVRWTNDGKPDEDRFAFRSPWQAWIAAHKLREAKQS